MHSDNVLTVAMMNIDSSNRKTDVSVDPLHSLLMSLHWCVQLLKCEVWMCCLLQTVWLVPLMSCVCWLTWLHAFGLPPILSPSSTPLLMDHGNVMMHGNISQDCCYKKLVINVELIIVFYPFPLSVPCYSIFASLVLPGLFSAVWSAVNVRSPGSTERWFANGCGPTLSSRAGCCTSGYESLTLMMYLNRPFKILKMTFSFSTR